MSESYEEHERMLEPHRVEEQHNARREAIDRLRDRGIEVPPSDSDQEIADLLETIEQFERAVEALGGDLMVNRIGADEPQDPAFVLPERRPNEIAREYAGRVQQATVDLRRRQRAD
ncbi:MAG TPA: hypothetical protein VJ717_09065 [Gemmatimonadaceae bacterium]|nr:hypothetical protein [Gemmatimonadaceae bacterium]